MQAFINKTNWLNYFTVITLAVVFLLVLVWGFGSGKSKAQSETSLNQALQIQTALEYFFKDNDSYPSSFEFKDVKVMGSYFKKFPINFVPSENCNQNLLYQRIKLTQYELSFCLDAKTQGFESKWNKLTSPVR